MLENKPPTQSKVLEDTSDQAGIVGLCEEKLTSNTDPLKYLSQISDSTKIFLLSQTNADSNEAADLLTWILDFSRVVDNRRDR